MKALLPCAVPLVLCLLLVTEESPANPAAAVKTAPLDRAILHGETDKARAIDYAPGEEMVLTLSLQGAGDFAAGAYFGNWIRTGDDAKRETGRVDAKDLPITVRTRLDRPGFVRIEAVVTDTKGVAYRRHFTGDATTPEGKRALNEYEKRDDRICFDGGAGVKVDSLQSVPEPEDFDEFWAKRRARLQKIPMTATAKEEKSVAPAVRVTTFSVLCAGPRPVTGTVTVPTDRTRRYPARIGFHGYGTHYIQPIPKTGPKNEIYMFINAHGYELGREDEYYTEFYDSLKSNGMPFGLDGKWQNKSTETAYFGWMIYRIMRALQYLKSFPEWNGRDLVVEGGSMGGCQAIWAAGIDPDVTLAKVTVPWCCDVGGRETMKRLYPGVVHETAALRYFDPVNFAKRVNPRSRVEITRAGLGDYVCPPSGIAILYNNLKCKKSIRWVQGSTHGYVPEEKHQEFKLSSDVSEND